MSGLLEILVAHGGREDLPKLAHELTFEVDDLLPLVDAAQVLGLAEVDDADLHVTDDGRTFVAADILESKQIFARRARERAPLVRAICNALDTTEDGNLGEGFFLDLLRRGFSEDEARQQLRIAIDWGRYGELFDFDANSGSSRSTTHRPRSAPDQQFRDQAPDSRRACSVYVLLIQSRELFTLCFGLTAQNCASIGGAHVWDRLLCAIDQFESGQTALDLVAGVASANGASVRVLHIREVPKMARVLPLESPAEAEELVRDAVLSLQGTRHRSRGTVTFRAARSGRTADRGGSAAVGVPGGRARLPSPARVLPAFRSRCQGADPQNLDSASARGSRGQEQRDLLASEVQV